MTQHARKGATYALTDKMGISVCIRKKVDVRMFVLGTKVGHEVLKHEFSRRERGCEYM